MGALRRELRSGDVILVEGNKLISRVVMAVTHSTWSHCALYVGDGKIIDPLPSTGTAVNDVEVIRRLNIRVCRPIGLPDPLLQRVCDFALSHVGRGYDHINVSNVLFSYFRKQQDPTEFLGDISASNEVCSGLIAEAFDQIGYRILDGVNFSQIVPSDFDLSPYFTIVKFPHVRKFQPEEERVRTWDRSASRLKFRA